jgi:hypothetical protein
MGSHDDRLHEAFGADRVGELVELLFAKVPARIEAAALELIDPNQALLAIGWQPGLRDLHFAD